MFNPTDLLIVQRAATKYKNTFAELRANILNFKLPTASTNHNVARFDGTTGVIQDSQVTIGDNGSLIAKSEIRVTSLTANRYGYHSVYDTTGAFRAYYQGWGNVTNTECVLHLEHATKMKFTGGQFQFSDIKYTDGNQAIGAVLTSDGDGKAIWSTDVGMPFNGLFVASHTIPAGKQGVITMDCTGGARSVVFPQATGSGKRYIVNVINCSQTNYCNLSLPSGERINNCDSNPKLMTDQSVEYVDADVNQYTSPNILTVDAIQLEVPSQFPTIQAALDGSLKWRSRRGHIYIRVANGDHHITEYLRCFHPQNIRIRGTTAQFFPRPDGIDTTYTGDPVADKATAAAMGGTRLLVNTTVNGLYMIYAPSVSFYYLQIVDNLNGTPDVTPSNYLVRDDGGSMVDRAWDRVQLVGSKYGMYMKDSISIYLAYVTLVHCTIRGLYITDTPYFNAYRLGIWYSQYGIYGIRVGSMNLSRLHIDGKWAGAPATTRGVYLDSTNASFTYPKIYVKKECIYANVRSTARVSVTASALQINKTELHGANVMSAYNRSFLTVNGNSTANMDIRTTANKVVYVVNSNCSLTAALSPTANPNLTGGEFVHILQRSTGYGGVGSGLTMSPAAPVKVIGNDQSWWQT